MANKEAESQEAICIPRRTQLSATAARKFYINCNKRCLV